MYKIYFNILLFLPLLSFSQEKNITDELSIGKYYQGGIIGYILQDGDIGYDPKVRHGIIVSTEDQSDGIRWYNGISILNFSSQCKNGRHYNCYWCFRSCTNL